MTPPDHGSGGGARSRSQRLDFLLDAELPAFDVADRDVFRTGVGKGVPQFGLKRPVPAVQFAYASIRLHWKSS